MVTSFFAFFKDQKGAQKAQMDQSSPVWRQKNWNAELDNDAVVVRFSSDDGVAKMLSNLYPCDVQMGGVTYPSAEHAFQCGKMLRFRKDDVVPSLLGVEAKQCKHRAGTRGFKRARLTTEDAKSWNGGISRQVMADVIGAKFSRGSVLAAQLLGTGDRPIVEKLAKLCDRTWGVDKHGNGENRTGRLLMARRAELRSMEEDHEGLVSAHAV